VLRWERDRFDLLGLPLILHATRRLFWNATVSAVSIDPMPPIALGAVLGLLRDPTAFFQRTRARLGDTFVVDVFRYRLLCVFSPEGVRNLWALPEAAASKGLADFALLTHKVPTDLFAGRRTMPHDLFGTDDVEVYLDHLDQAIAIELAQLGISGSFEVFAFTRRLAHRMGLASWGGLDAAAPDTLDVLGPLFDQLDSSESFVHPSRAFWTIATRKRAERRALSGIEKVFEKILAERDARPAADDLFSRICARWSDTPSPERARGIARDVVLVHMGSQSNLFAAIAWTLIYVLADRALHARIRAGDDALLDRCGHEAIRLAQRSIVLRRVVAPLDLADESTRYAVSPGAFVATMMSVTNTTASPGLDHFDPERYRGAVLREAADLPARELVTTFGHGRHFCPAQRFSTSAIRHSLRALIARFDLEARYADPRPIRRQIGGVARADRPCVVGYRIRA
jgi:cytochrome P450